MAFLLRKQKTEKGFLDCLPQPDVLPVLCRVLDRRGRKIMFKGEQLDKLDEMEKYC